MREAHSRSPPEMKRKAHTTLLLLLALAALASVFALYAQPDFVVQLSNQIWACF